MNPTNQQAQGLYRLAYIDRSKTDGRMITVDLGGNHWEERITTQIQEGQS